MATIERAIPVGGAALNFTVVGGATAPANPKENTFWVNTDVEVTGWAFAAEAPDYLAAGGVWIKTGNTSSASFNSMKKNTLIVYPQSCSQWDGGSNTWVTREALVYKNGEWIAMKVWLLLDGVAGADTGGFSVLNPSVTPSRGMNTFNLSSSGLRNAASGENQLNAAGTVEKIDVSGASTLYVEYTVSNAYLTYWLAFGLSENRTVNYSSYNGFPSQPWAAYNSYQQKAAGTYVDAIDISSLNGEHYFNVCLLISGNYATCTLTISKIWVV